MIPHTSYHRLPALLLSIVMLVSLLIPAMINPVSAASNVVYIGPNGNDGNTGRSASSPYLTYKKALGALSKTADATLVVTGAMPEQVKDTTLSAFTSTKTLTITGRDPATGTVYPDASITYESPILYAPTVFTHIYMDPCRSSCFVNTRGNPITIGEGVTYNRYNLLIHDGCYYGTSAPSTLTTVTDGAVLPTLCLGGAYITSASVGVNGDARLEVDHATVSQVVIGNDSYLSGHINTFIKGNLVIHVTSGKIGEVRLAYTSGAEEAIGGYAVVISDGSSDVHVNAIPQAAKGTYVIHTRGNAVLTETADAGKFRVIGLPEGYIVSVNGKKTSLNGDILTLTPGTYTVDFSVDAGDIVLTDGAYIRGYEDGTFRPNGNITRAEAASLFLSLFSMNEVENLKSSFSDISPNDWYFAPVTTLEMTCRLPVTWVGECKPNTPITRAEFVQILANLYTRVDFNTFKLESFTDVPLTHPHYQAIVYAVQRGYVGGYGDGTFRPDTYITRGEAVTILNRVSSRKASPDSTASFGDIHGHWAEDQILAASGDYLKKDASEGYRLPQGGAAEYVTALYNQSPSLSPEAIRAGVDTLSEQMKQDILYSPNVTFPGRGSYYISEKNGNDENDGRTPETAWKTLTRLNKEAQFAPSGVVYFERGGIYRGTINLISGYTYTAYGEGPKPLLMQSRRDYADPSLWVETEWPNVWRCTVPLNNVGIIGFDHDLYDYSEDSYNETYGKIMNLFTRNFKSPADFTEDLQFYSALANNSFAQKGDLFLVSTDGNPGSRFRSIEIGEQQTIMSGSSNYVTIDNLAFKFTGSHAMGAGTCTGRTVTNCVFSWLGGSVLSGGISGSAVNYGNAVEIYGGCYNYRVSNNWMYQIYDTAVTYQYTTTDACVQNGVRFTGNLCEYCHWSIEYYNGRPDPYDPNDPNKYTKDVVNCYNVCRMGGYGWGSIVRFRQTSAQMYCCANFAANSDIYCQYNIFDRCAGPLINCPDVNTEEFIRNIYIQDKGRAIGYLRNRNVTMSENAYGEIHDRLGDIAPVVVLVTEA